MLNCLLYYQTFINSIYDAMLSPFVTRHLIDAPERASFVYVGIHENRQEYLNEIERTASEGETFCILSTSKWEIRYFEEFTAISWK